MFTSIDSSVLQLHILLEYVIAHVYSEDEAKESLWSLVPDLVSRTVSAVVELCSYLSEHGEVHSTHEGELFTKSSRSVVIKIIGNLGVPDLYSIHPDALPFRHGTNARNCVSI